MKKRNLLFLVLGLPMVAFGQTKEERERIASFSNKEGNTKLALELKQEDDQRKLRLSNYLAANPFVKKVIKDDESGRLEIMDVLPNGEIIYAKTDNAGSAITSRANRLYSGGSLGLNIQGQNMTAGVWDGGNIRYTHQEFMVNGVSKVQAMDGNSFAEHATHVGGTIAAQGIVSGVRGIAFNSSLLSYDWTGDLSEMLLEASSGLLVSNHSYGIGSLGSAWFFGAYDSRAQTVDELCFSNPYYLPVFSAGNNRGVNTPPSSTQMANKFGYDMIFGHGNAKNVLTVAAVKQVDNYVNDGSVEMSTFSSWGPSDDGRIKPEISTKGVAVLSTISGSDTATGVMQGTSMASPGIAGVALLLQQYYNSLYSNYMRAATLKGLILHTADESGQYLGPDYEFGWGLVNAEKASIAIRDKNLSTNKSIIEEKTLNNGTSYSTVINSSGTTPLKISISWSDPESLTYNSGSVDPTTKYLVNDLDVKVVGPGGITYYPWKLQGMQLPFDAATNTTTNDVDNFERIDIPNPNGQYTVIVTHKGTLVNNMQPFSIIATSQNMSVLSVNDFDIDNNGLSIYPNPVKNQLNLVSKSNKIKDYKIVNSIGQLIITGNLLNEKNIKVDSLKSGEYILIVGDELGNYQSIKFIKN